MDQENVVIHIHNEVSGDLKKIIYETHHLIKKLMATQAEIAQQLADLGTQIGKIGTETTATLQKVAELEAALGNQTDVSPELQAAFDGLKAQVQVVDDLIPDATVAPAP